MPRSEILKQSWNRGENSKVEISSKVLIKGAGKVQHRNKTCLVSN